MLRERKVTEAVKGQDAAQMLRREWRRPGLRRKGTEIGQSSMRQLERRKECEELWADLQPSTAKPTRHDLLERPTTLPTTVPLPVLATPP